jgi:hypothetical protein
LTCFATACIKTGTPSELRQLASTGTATRNREVFLRSAFDPSGVVPRPVMIADFLLSMGPSLPVSDFCLF